MLRYINEYDASLWVSGVRPSQSNLASGKKFRKLRKLRKLRQSVKKRKSKQAKQTKHANRRHAKLSKKYKKLTNFFVVDGLLQRLSQRS